ncbi:hypothetical protein [Micromonospora sp. CPCC 206061]|uniref:hypothetical protein n=1 Tax=Micromonospora sp. CPCC 206061 TaxID=3122410 RepID=UPI002FF26D50
MPRDLRVPIWACHCAQSALTTWWGFRSYALLDPPAEALFAALARGPGGMGYPR